MKENKTKAQALRVKSFGVTNMFPLVWKEALLLNKISNLI